MTPMMKHSLLFLYITLFGSSSLGQDFWTTNDSIPKKSITYVDSYIPQDCFDSTFYLEKLEEVSSQELYVLLNEDDYTDYSKEMIIEGVEYFNSMGGMKINQRSETFADKEHSTTFIPIYSSDIADPPRFMVKTKFNFEIHSNWRYNTSYYIFDNVSQTAYQEFYSLEMLADALERCEQYMSRGRHRDQADLDLFWQKKMDRHNRKSVPKVQREKGSGNFWWGVLIVANIALLIATFVS